MKNSEKNFPGLFKNCATPDNRVVLDNRVAELILLLIIAYYGIT